jgi:hypothetical protein
MEDIMNRTVRLAVLAGVAVLVVSLIPYLGSLVLAPLMVLALSARAGRQAAAESTTDALNQAAKAGTLVGMATLIGSIVGLTLLVVLAVRIPAVQEYIRASEPHPDARIPYAWIVPLGAVAGSIVGFFIGLVDLLLAILCGMCAGWVADRNRQPVTV